METFTHLVDGKSYNIPKFPIKNDVESCELKFKQFVESREEFEYDEGTTASSCVTDGGKSSPKEDILIYGFYELSLKTFDDCINDFVVFSKESLSPGLSTETAASHRQQAASFYEEALDSYCDVIWSSEKYKKEFPNDRSEMIYPDAFKTQ